LNELHKFEKQIDLYVLDFSYSREVIQGLAHHFKNITILDHHKTAAEALENWTDKPENCTIVFDMNRSGCGITWDHFHTSDAIYWKPAVVKYVQDRDLWKFQLSDSKEINAFIAASEFTFEEWDMLEWELVNRREQTVAIGAALMKQHRKIAEEIASHRTYCAQTDGVTELEGVQVNCPPQFASEVGNILAQKYSFAQMWWVDEKNNCNCSLRSTGDFDVSAIAKFYGGGGHKNAAGFSVPANEWEF